MSVDRSAWQGRRSVLGKSPARRMIARIAAALLLGTLFVVTEASPMHAQAADMIRPASVAGSFSYYMSDPRWGSSGLGPLPQTYRAGQKVLTRDFAVCGCLTTALADVLEYEFGPVSGYPGNHPTYNWTTPVDWAKYDAGYGSTGPYNPLAIDTYLRKTHGYIGKGAVCGTAVRPTALTSVAIPSTILGQSGPSGIELQWIPVHGLGDPVAGDAIRKAIAGFRPVIAVQHWRNVYSRAEGLHAYIVTGWDSDGDYQSVDVSDPLRTTKLHTMSEDDVIVPGATGYERWSNNIEMLMTYTLTLKGKRWAGISDAPGAVDVTTTGPSGERTGWNGQSAQPFDEDATGSYQRDYLENDPLGAAPCELGVSVNYSDPQPGLYRYVLRNDGDQVARFTADSGDTNTQSVTLDQDIEVAAHSSAKYLMAYDGTTASITRVEDFAPQPLFRTPSNPVDKHSIVFDGSNSFDVDGSIQMYKWDFGDGTADDGASPSHTFDRPGTYRVTLTVGDDTGQAASASHIVQVRPYETDPPITSIEAASADPAGTSHPVGDGDWVSGDVLVLLRTTDQGNDPEDPAVDDPSGVDHLIWWSTGAQTQDKTVVAGGRANVHITAEGRTTIYEQGVDKEGNTEDPASFTVGVDRTLPSSHPSSPPDGSALSRLPFVGGTATDDNVAVNAVAGPDTTAITLQRAHDRSYWTGTSWAADPTWLETSGHHHWFIGSGLPKGSDLADGTYAVRSRTTDVAGNTGPVSDPVTFAIHVEQSTPVILRQLASGGTETFPPDNEWPRAALDAHTIVGAGFDGSVLGDYARTALQWAGANSTVNLTPLAGSRGAQANAIATDGTVVGASWYLGRPIATRWANGTVTRLPDIPGVPAGLVLESDAYAVDSGGDIVGWSTYADTASYPLVVNRVATVWRQHGTVATRVPALGNGDSVARAINDDGVIVGDTTSDLGVVGQAFEVLPGQQASALPSLGGDRSYALAINHAGDIVGASNAEPGGVNHAVEWTDGQIIDLGPGVATAIADDGTVAGLRDTGSGDTAAIWRAGRETDLADALPAATGWNFNIGNAWGWPTVDGRSVGFDDVFPAPVLITTDGAIVGTGLLGGHYHGYVITGILSDTSGSTGDTTPPATTATITPAPNAAGWNNAPVTVDLHAVDVTSTGTPSGVAGIFTTAPGHSWTAAEQVDLHVSTPGRTDVLYAAQDNAGNTEDPYRAATVQIDPTPPSVRATASQDEGAWSNVPVTVDLTATDNQGGSGVQGIITKLSEAEAETHAGSLDSVVVSAEGASTLRFWGSDVAGNSSSEQDTVIRIDTTAPKIELGAAELPAGAVPDLNVTDPLSGVAGCRQPSATRPATAPMRSARR